MAYEDILQQLGDYLGALAEERRLARAGLKARPALVSVHEKYRDLFLQERIVALRELIERAPHPKKRDQFERALFALLEGVAEADTLPFEEKLFLKMAEPVETGFGEMPYHDLPTRIAHAEDPAEREALRQVQAARCEALSPVRLDLEHARRQAIAKFGFGSLREYSEAKKRFRYDALLQKTIPILQETTGLYRRVMSDVLRRAYHLELGELSAAHALHWRSGSEFSHFFPPERLPFLIQSAFATIGLPFERAPQVRFDIEERPGKQTEACHAEPKAPAEVHLALAPEGGYEGVRVFLHESGHAAHAAGMDAALPYEWRGLPRSQALAEAFAAICEHLPEQPLWLEHVMRVPKAAAERLGASALLGNLFALRRDVARFSYALALDEKPYDAARNKELYAKTMRDLTGFVHEEAFWLEDADPAFFSADRLRGRIAAAQLEEHLIRTFGDRWFLKRDTGAFLKDLFAKGVSWDAEELVQSVGMTAWDPLPLLRKFDGVSRLLR